MNDENSSINFEIQKLARTIFEILQSSEKEWVAWRQIAKYQEGSDSEEIITKLCAVAELPSGSGNLQTNFRSQKAIVEIGNSLMAGLGKPGLPLPENSSGEVIMQAIDDIWVENRMEDSYSEARQDDQRFIFYEKRADADKLNDNGFLQAKYLKACYQIITNPDNLAIIAKMKSKQKDKVSVAILSRTNRLYRVTLNEFFYKLRTCFSKEELDQIGDFQQKIRVGTVHSYKGLEADIVIILRAVQGAFPLIHPDNALFSIFGQTEKDLLDEERRLFYVAITRAKQKLYILTEKDRKSDFWDQINTPNSSYVNRPKRRERFIF